jgi:hypothetical protein|tara:strand:- start:247 stop:462 length:216 start_codon:yes stop_codon:yes gene_type:complete
MKLMKNKQDDIVIERLKEISMAEIKSKYPDKIVDAYVEGGRLVVVLDKCRLKFDERVPQKDGNVYGAIHRK